MIDRLKFVVRAAEHGVTDSGTMGNYFARSGIFIHFDVAEFRQGRESFPGEMLRHAKAGIKSESDMTVRHFHYDRFGFDRRTGAE
jgi:hypothetical protein